MLRSLFQEAKEEKESNKKEKGWGGPNFKVCVQKSSPSLMRLHIWNHLFIRCSMSQRAFQNMLPSNATMGSDLYSLLCLWWHSAFDELMIKGLSKICCQRARRNSHNLPVTNRPSHWRPPLLMKWKERPSLTAVTVCQVTRLTTQSHRENTKQMKTFLRKWACEQKGKL